MKTSKEYKQSLKKMKSNIYKFGELIEDVTTNPATKRTVEGHAQIFDASQKDEYKDIITTKSNLTGERISRYLSIIGSAEDMIANVRMKRLMFNLTGTCTRLADVLVLTPSMPCGQQPMTWTKNWEQITIKG